MAAPQLIGCVAVALVAVACGGGSTPATTPPALTAHSPLRGGPGGGFELCDGPICATNGDGFAIWDGHPMKILWRVEEGDATDALTVTARSRDGRQTFVVDNLGRATSPDDLAGYSYFPSGLEFPSPGTWVLELDSGRAVATIVVKVGEKAD